MNLYVQGFSESAREAQSRVIEMVRNAPLSERPQAHEAAVQA